MEKVNSGRQFADCVKQYDLGHDLTKLVRISKLCGFACERWRSCPTPYYRNWFRLWKVVESKNQSLSCKSCFPGTCDQVSITMWTDCVRNAARSSRARICHESHAGQASPDCLEILRGSVGSWTRHHNRRGSKFSGLRRGFAKANHIP